MTFRFRHLLAALILHALLLTVLAGGAQCSHKPVRPPVIRAVLLDPDRKEVRQQQQRREEQRKLEEQQRKQEELRKVEEKKKQEEIKRKTEEERKQREADLQKQKQIDEARRKKEDEAKRQKELAEKKKQEEQARRKKEQQEERERQEDAKRELQRQAELEQSMREESMRRQLEAESQARASSERELKLAQWVDALERHITRNWVRPPSATVDFQCQVRVQLLPDGSVTKASIVKSCGSGALDKSVEDAVYRSSPLPRPADPSIFDRDLIINFTPGS